MLYHKYMTTGFFPFAALIIIVCTPVSIFPLAYTKQFGPNELYLEIVDPYYAAAGTYFSLSGRPMPNLDTASEADVYSFLARNAFKPSFFLAEAGVFPFPCGGIALKKWRRKFYDNATIDSTNVVRALTESVNFKEPWSASVFLGNVVKFRSEKGGSEGTGNIGVLASYGNYHIKDNDLLRDHWGEFELKLKVDKSGATLRYSTSYRLGGRLHCHPDIRHLMYLSLMRNRTDFKKGGFWLTRNTNFQVRSDWAFHPAEVLGVSVEAGRKFPFKIRSHDFAAGLSFGVTWKIGNPYTGPLGAGFVRNDLSPIIKPLIQF
jgi:hypothetical protein